MFTLLSVHPVGVLVRCWGVLDSVLEWRDAVVADTSNQLVATYLAHAHLSLA